MSDDKKEGFNPNMAPEKVHDLIPEAYRTLSNDKSYNLNYPGPRLAFYA